MDAAPALLSGGRALSSTQYITTDITPDSGGRDAPRRQAIAQKSQLGASYQRQQRIVQKARSS